MSKVAIQGNASGTATFTVAAPVGTGVDRTLTLPDEAGTVLTSATSISTQATQNVPLFQVRRITSNQGISGNTWTKVDFNSTEVDTHSWVTGDDTFTPQIAGWYQFTVNLILSGASATFIAMRVMKNGSQAFVTSHLTAPSTNNSFKNGGSILIHMNGSTDYIEAQAFITAVNSSQVVSSTIADTSLQGFLVRAD
jgi:hypothetical protein